MSTNAEPKTNRRRIIIWGSVLALVILLIFLLPFLIDEPIRFYTYLNTKTLKTESFVRIGPMIRESRTRRSDPFLYGGEKDDPSLLDNWRDQGWLRPGETVQQERLPEYWILIRKQSTLLVAPKGGIYPVKLRNFLAEHYQEMMAPDYKETEEEFSARFTDFILSLNEDEKFKGALLPADTDLRARSKNN